VTTAVAATAVDPLAFAQALIRCPSVTPAEGGALDLLQRRLSELGFACHRLAFTEDGTPSVDNLYARIGTARPNFCFAGHTDVVPVGDAAAWRHPPFAATVEDGRLIGRGAVDMKSAIACFVAATSRFLARRPHGFGGSISLLITGDEEGPAVNGTVKVLDWLRRRGEALDGCIVGEPTNPQALGDMMKIGRRGSLNVVLTVRGVQGHVAYPHLADNPIPRLLRMLTRLTETPLDQGNDHFQPSSLNVTDLHVGNETTNVIPAAASARFNIRFNDIHTGAGLIRWVRQICDGVGGAYDLKATISGESFLTPPGRLSDALAAAVERATGRRPELSTSGGTSDARFIKDHCPVVEFGLTGKTMHQVDESTDVADLETLTAIYLDVLEHWFADGSGC